MVNTAPLADLRDRAARTPDARSPEGPTGSRAKDAVDLRRRVFDPLHNPRTDKVASERSLFAHHHTGGLAGQSGITPRVTVSSGVGGLSACHEDERLRQVAPTTGGRWRNTARPYPRRDTRVRKKAERARCMGDFDPAAASGVVEVYLDRRSATASEGVGRALLHAPVGHQGRAGTNGQRRARQPRARCLSPSYDIELVDQNRACSFSIGLLASRRKPISRRAREVALPSQSTFTRLGRG